MSGVISGSDGLTKNGSGVLDLEAANTYTGTTAIDGGTLQVDGTVGAVTPGTDTTLAGAGTVASIITTAATISPGGSSLGVLKDTGPLTLDAKSFFDPTINNGTAGTGYSQLNVAGAINLANATLDVTLSPSFTPTSGEQFTILNNTGSGAITGNFAGLTEGATLTISGQQFTISYKGGTLNNSVVLTAKTVSTATWSGGDVANSPDWSDTANWLNGVVPSNGFNVIFPPDLTSAEQQSDNDMTGLDLISILVQDTGFDITGNAVTLAGGLDSSQTSGLFDGGLAGDLHQCGERDGRQPGGDSVAQRGDHRIERARQAGRGCARPDRR